MHITEIGELQKMGTVRLERLVAMRLWYAEDTQTDSLAKDQCIIPAGKPKVRLTSSGIQCNPQTGCC